jgi:predicted DNA-binding transcriptional regulator AlpA
LGDIKLLIAANDNQPRRSVLPPSLPPRGLSREVAAEYFGISPSSFDLGVKDGTIPPPRRFRGRVLWDRIELDRAFDELPGSENGNPWDRVLAS